MRQNTLNNVGPSFSLPVTSWLAQLPNGLQKAVDRLILLRTRDSPKFCEWQRIKARQRRTIMTKIHELYEAEKKKKENDLAATKHQALAGDHLTTVSNDNYLVVPAHRRMEVKVVYTNVHENRRAPLCRGMCTTVPNCCKQLGN